MVCAHITSIRIKSPDFKYLRTVDALDRDSLSRSNVTSSELRTSPRQVDTLLTQDDQASFSRVSVQ